ncbi:MAG TPA: response regulator, partial [Syntrophales bacterium]|nr:response regulator [Syntrophales bacterium]
GEGELILLVEDEVDLLHIGRILLEKLGYRVIAATSPHEAIDVVKERGRELSLLITDMIMPGMSGIDLIKKVKECAPQVRFILSSGYGVGPLRGDKEMEFLEKPYTIETLAAKIKKVLGKV